MLEFKILDIYKIQKLKYESTSELILEGNIAYFICWHSNDRMIFNWPTKVKYKEFTDKNNPDWYSFKVWVVLLGNNDKRYKVQSRYHIPSCCVIKANIKTIYQDRNYDAR